jgi:hypothetical protein
LPTASRQLPPDKDQQNQEVAISKLLLAKLDEDLKLAGYAKRSRQSYVRAVRQLYNFWSVPLEEVREEQVREYWLHCKDELEMISISFSDVPAE